MASAEYYTDKFCACGCGRPLQKFEYHKIKMAKFIRGHNDNGHKTRAFLGMENEVVEKYRNGMSGVQIAKEHGVCPPTVYRTLERCGVSVKSYSECRRKYRFDEKAFDELTHEGAYWLGFIYADGSVSGKRKILSIGLHIKDKIILEEFLKFLHSTHPIYEFRYGTKNIVQIQIVSKYLVGRLAELGVIPKKTHVIRYPDFLPDELNSDFIRGYFDGDGSLTHSGGDYPQPVFSITSQRIFLEKVQEILMESCALNRTRLSPYKGKSSFDLRYGGTRQVNRIAKYLIQNPGFYLPRKLGRLQLAT